MKHLKIKNKVRFTISMLILFFIIQFIFQFLFHIAFSYQAPNYQEVIVSESETLWSIASHLEGNISENIYKIQKINQLENCNIYIGQSLKIPSS